MSDLLDQYVQSQSQEKEKMSGVLDQYVRSQETDYSKVVQYEDEDLNNFMQNPWIKNRLNISSNLEFDAAKYATTYLLAKKIGLPPDKVFENYDIYARHFYGDKSPVSNLQHIKDAYKEGELGTKMDLLAVEYAKGKLTPENKKKFEAERALLENQMPPLYNDNGNILMKSATGLAKQVYRQLYEPSYFLPTTDIERRINEATEDPTRKSSGIDILKGLNDYITGYDTNKKRTAYVSKWQAVLGSIAVGQGITLANALYYSELETGNTYNALSRIKTEDYIGADGEVVPGVGLDEDTMVALATFAGPIKGLAEAYFEKYALGKIPGLKRLFGDPKVLNKLISDEAVKLGIKGALLKALDASGAIEISEIGTELFQGTVDIAANNLAILLEKNKNYFKDDKITVQEAASIGANTLVETFWTVAPTAFFGGSFTGVIDLVNQNKYAKNDISNIVLENIRKTIKEDGNFSLDKVKTLVREDPRMEKYSDNAIERETSRIILEQERGEIINSAPKTITYKMFQDQMKEEMRAVFEKENPELLPGSDNYNTAFDTFQAERFNDFYAPHDLSKEALLEQYNRDHGKIDVAGTHMDENGNIVESKSYVDVTFDDYVRQRRERNAYSQVWSKTPDSQKYFATMDAASLTISQLLQEDVLTQTVKDDLVKQQNKIDDLIKNAKSKDENGIYVGSLQDFKVVSDLQVKAIGEEISRLEKLSREYQDDKTSQETIRQKTADLIKQKYELETTKGQIRHILNIVSQNLFNSNKLRNTLTDIDTRLRKRIAEFEDEETQAFFRGETKERDVYLEFITKSILEAEEMRKVEAEEKAKEENYLLDEELETYYDQLIKSLEGLKEEVSNQRKPSDVWDQITKGYMNMEWSRAGKIKNIENARLMVISQMQKALSNTLRINGDAIMKSLTGKLPKNISIPAYEKLKDIQDAIKKIGSVVSRQDIEEARAFVNRTLYKAVPRSKEIPSGYIRYEDISENVGDILMRDLEITYDENATAVPPKLSIEQLYDLKMQFDLLKYLGKEELAEAQKGRLITDEILRSEFRSYQKNLAEGKSKESSTLRKVYKGLQFETMMAAHWGEKLFGKFGRTFFWDDRLEADSNARKERRRRSDEIEESIGMDKKDIALKMHEEVDWRGKTFTKQQLMFYWLVREGHDRDTWTHLTSRNGNNVDPALIGELEDIKSPLDDLLSEKDKDIARAFQYDLQSAFHRISGTFETMTATRLGQIPFYLPNEIIDKKEDYQSLEEDIFTTMLRGSDYNEGAVNSRFTYTRSIPTPETAHEINDGLWDIWQNYIFKQEHYISHAEWVSRAKSFMNDKQISNTIKDNYNETWEAGIKKYIEDIANPSAMHGASNIDKFIRAVRHNVAVSALAFRPAIWLRQIPSVTMYLSEAGPAEMATAIGEVANGWYTDNKGKRRNKVFDFITDVDPTTMESDVGYEDMLGYRHPKTKYSAVKQKVDDIGMAPIKGFDKYMKAIGWKAIYNKNKVNLGEAEAIRQARSYTSLTQPSSDKSTLPGLYRHGEFANLLMMFTQQPTKIFNYMLNDVMPNLNFKNKDADKVAGFYGLASFATMNAVMWMLTKKQVPEDPEDWFHAIMTQGLSVIPVVGKAASTKLQGDSFYGGDISTSATGYFLDIFDLKDWDKGLTDPEEFAKQINKMQKAFGYLGWYSAAGDDWLDFLVTKNPSHVILGGVKGE